MTYNVFGGTLSLTQSNYGNVQFMARGKSLENLGKFFSYFVVTLYYCYYCYC